MTMRSSSGLMETDTDDLFLKLRLAHSHRECQDNYRPGLAVAQRECQRVPWWSMDVDELRELLSPEGLRLLDEVGPIASTADVVRTVSRLRAAGHGPGLVSAVLGQARLRA